MHDTFKLKQESTLPSISYSQLPENVFPSEYFIALFGIPIVNLRYLRF